MPRPCTVCTHPKVNEINRMLVAGRTTYRNMAVLWGLPTTNLYRHRAEHIPAQMAQSAQIREQIALADLAGLAATVQEQSFRLLAEASRPADEQTGKGLATPKLMAVALREAREGLRLMGEVAGQLRPPGSSTVTVNNQPTAVVQVYEIPSNGRLQSERAAAVARLASGNGASGNGDRAPADG